ncbi:MAG: phosphopantetheine-binding protein [Bacteroidales bacterium]|nr:phosphopantetheine-binding protein [Bacteroidales bacterium]
MNAVEIKAKLRPHLSKLFNVPEEKITDTANFFTDLNVDSLMMLEVVSLIESECNVTLKQEEDAAKLTSLDECANVAIERMASLV